MKSMKQMLGNERERKSLGRKLFAIGIVGLFLGVIGIALTTIAITVIPFIVGQAVTEGQQQPEVYGKESSKSITERWKGLTGKKKVGVGIGMVFLLPFIAIALMWFMVVGTTYWVDILFVVPIFLIAGFLFFHKKEKQTNAISKVLGNPIMGVIGIVIIGFLIFMAAQNYMAEGQYKNKQVYTYATPLTTDATDYLTHNGTVQYATDANGNYTLDANGQPMPKLKTISSLTFRCVDDFFYSINFKSVLYQNQAVKNGTITNDTKTSLSDTSGLLPIPNARVSLDLKSNDTKNLLAVGQKTDANGLVMFNGVPYGTYMLSVDIGGYFKFSRTVHLNENFDKQVVNVHLMPVYYRVSLSYAYAPDTSYDTAYRAWQLIDAHSTAKVFLAAHYDGGITVADLQNLRRQQSWYGWSGVDTGGISNQMLQNGQQMQSMMNDWTVIFDYIVPGLGLVGALNAQADIDVYMGHRVDLTHAYVVDSGGNHPAYWRQFPSANSQQIQNTSTPSATANQTATQNNTLQTSTLTERTYVYALWTTFNAEGNTFKCEFNISTYYTHEHIAIFNGAKSSMVMYKNIEVTWDTELPSMSTSYWSAK